MRRATRSLRWRGGVLALLAAAGGTAFATGLPGELDPSYGQGGVTVEVQTPASVQALGTTVQPDGKTVVVGAQSATSGAARTYRWGVWRRQADGSPDASFGNGGEALAFSASSSWVRARDVVVDASGASLRLLVGGTSQVTIGSGRKATTAHAATIARLDDDGALDSTFGSGGAATLLPTGAVWSREAFVIRAVDGRIYATGMAAFNSGKSVIQRPFVARLTSAGTLDSSFGSGGYAVDGTITITYQSGNTLYPAAFVKGIALHPLDGGVLVGHTLQGTGWRVVRFLATGSLDAAFGSGGSLVAPPGTTAVLREIALDASGRLLATGRYGAGQAVVRYTGLGALDGTFGSGGVAGLPSPGAGTESTGLALEASGRIAVSLNYAGTCGLAALLPDGSLDAAFGAGGVSDPLPAPTTSATSVGSFPGVAVSPDGGLVLGGYFTAAPSTTAWYLARYLP